MGETMGNDGMKINQPPEKPIFPTAQEVTAKKTEPDGQGNKSSIRKAEVTGRFLNPAEGNKKSSDIQGNIKSEKLQFETSQESTIKKTLSAFASKIMKAVTDFAAAFRKFVSLKKEASKENETIQYEKIQANFPQKQEPTRYPLVVAGLKKEFKTLTNSTSVQSPKAQEKMIATIKKRLEQIDEYLKKVAGNKESVKAFEEQKTNFKNLLEDFEKVHKDNQQQSWDKITNENLASIYKNMNGKYNDIVNQRTPPPESNLIQQQITRIRNLIEIAEYKKAPDLDNLKNLKENYEKLLLEKANNPQVKPSSNDLEKSPLQSTQKNEPLASHKFTDLTGLTTLEEQDLWNRLL